MRRRDIRAASWLLLWLFLAPQWTDASDSRCAQQTNSCRVLICDPSLVEEVQDAYEKGELVELLRHTAKEEKHPDDESAPLTRKGIEQAGAIRDGLIKAGLVPQSIQVSSYRRTRQTAARAIPRRDGQEWTEPPELRKDLCFGAMAEFLSTEARTKGNSLYLTHSSCIFSALYVDRNQYFDPTGDKNYGVMIFLNRNDLRKPIACMWPSDWSLWPTDP